MIFRGRVATEDVLWSNNDFLDYSATGSTAYKEPAGFLQTMDNRMIHSTWKNSQSFTPKGHYTFCRHESQSSLQWLCTGLSGSSPTVWGRSLSFQGTHFASDMIGYASTLCWAALVELPGSCKLCIFLQPPWCVNCICLLWTPRPT